MSCRDSRSYAEAKDLLFEFLLGTYPLLLLSALKDQAILWLFLLPSHLIVSLLAEPSACVASCFWFASGCCAARNEFVLRIAALLPALFLGSAAACLTVKRNILRSNVFAAVVFIFTAEIALAVQGAPVLLMLTAPFVLLFTMFWGYRASFPLRKRLFSGRKSEAGPAGP